MHIAHIYIRHGYKTASKHATVHRPVLCKHVSSTSTSDGFSSAAATRSLSFSCLLTMGVLLAPPRHGRTAPTCLLTLVRTGFDADIDFKAGGQGAKQTDADGQPDKGGHSTMRYGWGELDNYATGSHRDLGRGNDGQLF